LLPATDFIEPLVLDHRAGSALFSVGGAGSHLLSHRCGKTHDNPGILDAAPSIFLRNDLIMEKR